MALRLAGALLVNASYLPRVSEQTTWNGMSGLWDSWEYHIGHAFESSSICTCVPFYGKLRWVRWIEEQGKKYQKPSRNFRDKHTHIHHLRARSHHDTILCH
ncbi:hypothetical protein EDB19DRAFT_1767684, partial [Suillus lakei]